MRGGNAVRRRSAIIPLAVLLWVSLPTGAATATDDGWHRTDNGVTTVNLYFVYTSTCPHCERARPFIEELDDSRPWLHILWLQADLGDPEVERMALAVAEEIGEPIRGVPTFMFCGVMITGYDRPEGTGVAIAAELDACYARYTQDKPPRVTSTTAPLEVVVPGIGAVSAASVPLPVFTIIVAGLDAFNPCAFFVLLFLLSLLARMQNRTRMAVVGFTFVAISGILYFVFMAAWLNLFLVAGRLKWITAVAGAVEIVLKHSADTTLVLSPRHPPLPLESESLYRSISADLSHVLTLSTMTPSGSRTNPFPRWEPGCRYSKSQRSWPLQLGSGRASSPVPVAPDSRSEDQRDWTFSAVEQERTFPGLTQV